jgi:hypothetical protein
MREIIEIFKMDRISSEAKIRAIIALGRALNYEYGSNWTDEIVKEAGIRIPNAYSLGFHNNNCLKTGCVQGGIGYWKKMQKEFPDKFERMARIEHELTDKKGQPVTMLKDQSKTAKDSGNVLVFLKKHKDYPDLKCIDDMDGRVPEPLADCNGFCGVNDLVSDGDLLA